MTVLVGVDSLTDYPPIPPIETRKHRTVAHVVCPFVKRRHVNVPNGWPVDHLVAKAMKHVQDGPSIYTKEWNEVYARRNAVESVNGTLKGALGAFIDDPRTRLMRGWFRSYSSPLSL